VDLAAFYRSQLASHFKEQMMVPKAVKLKRIRDGVLAPGFAPGFGVEKATAFCR
jgi:hypothetical protein